MTLAKHSTSLVLVLLLAPLLRPLMGFLPGPDAVLAQDTPILTWTGEIRPRFESREPVVGSWDHLTSMRTRLGMEALMETGLRMFIQVQDVRNWGEEETERDRSADAVDFHQAYLEVDRIPALGGLIRAGRQEVGVAEQRLMSAPDWGQGGQAFDGVRWIQTLNASRFEFVYLKIQENSSPSHDHDADFLSGWLVLPLGDAGTLDLVGVYDHRSGPDGTAQKTAGGIWRRDHGPVSLRFQSLFQFGERDGADVRAYMLAARAGVTGLDGKGTVTLWYDHLSGDGDFSDEEIGAFSTLYGARNRYYGRADYFTDIPSHTGGGGLRDAVLKLTFRPRQELVLNLDLHSLSLAKNVGVLESRHLAEEVDGWIQYQVRRHLTLQAGYSLTWADDAMEALQRLEGVGNFGYAMTSLRF